MVSCPMTSRSNVLMSTQSAAEARKIPLGTREGTEEPIVRIKDHPRDTISEESGRTLEVTLHEVLSQP